MTYLLDDFADSEVSRFGTAWRFMCDQVMGGQSQGSLELTISDSKPCLHLHGQVAAEIGFIQAALSLVHSRYLFDARHFSGVWLTCRSEQSEGFWLHLRSKELSMPWQHYAAAFEPVAQWRQLKIPFAEFLPQATGHELNLERLTSIGIACARRQFYPDLFVSEIGFY
ncbi:MAG: NADH:ubiquinone oxidoreductase [Candidatus Melainabacteria bacterium HGW-Melainabacteria-1]|nr:MAG: NADH:ubiquinone oxidoreductase [Candidatus Melainabacteria bacterium HGW-Melainabacteria-1]